MLSSREFMCLLVVRFAKTLAAFLTILPAGHALFHNSSSKAFNIFALRISLLARITIDYENWTRQNFCLQFFFFKDVFELNVS